MKKDFTDKIKNKTIDKVKIQEPSKSNLEYIKIKYITDEGETVRFGEGAIRFVTLELNNVEIGRLELDILSDEVIKDIIIEPFRDDNNINKNDKQSWNNLQKFEDNTKKLSHVFMIQHIYIEKQYRENGLGSILINEGIKVVKDASDNHSNDILYLVAAPDDKTMDKEVLFKMYEKFGFDNPIFEDTSVFMFNVLDNLEIPKIKKVKSKKKTT